MKTDYISREAFIESQQHLYCENCARRKNGKGKFVYDIGDAPCRACGIMDVLDAAEDFPAADVRPNLRGKWERFEDDFGKYDRCSNCGKEYAFGPIVAMHYCPNCGANMREES